MLEVVISGIHRADEDDIWGNEITHRPEKTFDPIVVEGKRINAITLPAFTYIHEGIITSDVPNHMVRDASVRLSPTLAIVSRAALDAHNTEIKRLRELWVALEKLTEIDEDLPISTTYDQEGEQLVRQWAIRPDYLPWVQEPTIAAAIIALAAAIDKEADHATD